MPPSNESSATGSWGEVRQPDQESSKSAHAPLSSYACMRGACYPHTERTCRAFDANAQELEGCTERNRDVVLGHEQLSEASDAKTLPIRSINPTPSQYTSMRARRLGAARLIVRDGWEQGRCGGQQVGSMGCRRLSQSTCRARSQHAREAKWARCRMTPSDSGHAGDFERAGARIACTRSPLSS